MITLRTEASFEFLCYIFYKFYNLKNNSTEFSAKFDKEKQFEDEKYSIFEKKSQMTEYSSMLEILDNYDGKIL